MKYLLTVIALSAGSFAVSACTSNSPADAPPGHYESYKSSTDSSGTTHTTTKSTDVSVDEDGEKKAVVKSKTTKDPEGMFNKRTTSESEAVYEEDK